MCQLLKPPKLHIEDTIATISPCNGWAGDSDIYWRYLLGVERLKEIGLNVVSAPNSLKGSEYLLKNPEARADDFMWAFENKTVNAIIANIGGNDSIKIIQYINKSSIKNNHKIFIGYSDVMNLHILCYKCSLSTFYGDNLLNSISEPQGWHSYSKHWFMKTLFCSDEIGEIYPSKEWTYEEHNYTKPSSHRHYYPNYGYELLQGNGIVKGSLFGGHTGLMESKLELSSKDFENKILFLEDIPEFYSAKVLTDFFIWLKSIKALQKIKGIILGKSNDNHDFFNQKEVIIKIIDNEDLPVLYGLNFGHSSPTCILPYGAMAEIHCTNKTFSILDSGVR